MAGVPLACEQALLFGRVKRVSRERARFACPNRRACSQAIVPQNHPRKQAASSYPVEIEFTPTPLQTYTHTTKMLSCLWLGSPHEIMKLYCPLKKFILVTQHNVG